MFQSKTLATSVQKDYELLDSGDGEKLERFGAYILRRPDPQALWQKNLLEAEWKKASAYFKSSSQKSSWERGADFPKDWNVEITGLTFKLKLSAFKHVGVFPEQLPNWQWMRTLIEKSGRKVSVLNLFGYTGGATLACASVGAEVTHVDGSKTSLTLARENASLSGLGEKPIRWILDDALAYVKREVKRGKKYDGIIMDPPAYGHGSSGEIWKIEKDLPNLFNECKKILSDNPLFFLINGYASGYSAIAYKNNLENLLKDFSGEIEAGELVLEESKSKRLLPAGIYARWQAN